MVLRTLEKFRTAKALGWLVATGLGKTRAAAMLMRDWLDEGKTGPEDMDPFAVSHLGWGMNPQCRWETGTKLPENKCDHGRYGLPEGPAHFVRSCFGSVSAGGKPSARTETRNFYSTRWACGE
jgi:hypothetical protein